ncbi:hypothetical protein QJQ45_015740 [Haematococcus lacustris]|nr:hypothetical protein QJQ45_015740 [Haematococcus lacustris]
MRAEGWGPAAQGRHTAAGANNPWLQLEGKGDGSGPCDSGVPGGRQQQQQVQQQQQQQQVQQQGVEVQQEESGLQQSKVALKAGFPELAAKLHPRSDLEGIWSPQDLAKYTNSGAVAPLQVLVGRVLEARLMASIQECVDCMKLLGTFYQAGRVFGREGVYAHEGEGQAQSLAGMGSAYAGLGRSGGADEQLQGRVGLGPLQGAPRPGLYSSADTALMGSSWEALNSLLAGSSSAEDFPWPSTRDEEGDTAADIYTTAATDITTSTSMVGSTGMSGLPSAAGALVGWEAERKVPGARGGEGGPRPAGNAGLRAQPEGGPSTSSGGSSAAPGKGLGGCSYGSWAHSACSSEPVGIVTLTHRPQHLQADPLGKKLVEEPVKLVESVGSVGSCTTASLAAHPKADTEPGAPCNLPSPAPPPLPPSLPLTPSPSPCPSLKCTSCQGPASGLSVSAVGLQRGSEQQGSSSSSSIKHAAISLLSAQPGCPPAALPLPPPPTHLRLPWALAPHGQPDSPGAAAGATPGPGQGGGRSSCTTRPSSNQISPGGGASPCPASGSGVSSGADLAARHMRILGTGSHALAILPYTPSASSPRKRRTTRGGGGGGAEGEGQAGGEERSRGPARGLVVMRAATALAWERAAEQERAAAAASAAALATPPRSTPPGHGSPYPPPAHPLPTQPSALLRTSSAAGGALSRLPSSCSSPPATGRDPSHAPSMAFAATAAPAPSGRGVEGSSTRTSCSPPGGSSPPRGGEMGRPRSALSQDFSNDPLVRSSKAEPELMRLSRFGAGQGSALLGQHPAGSAAVRGGKRERVMEVVRSWVGYDRMYDAKRGAAQGSHGQEASALRRYETKLEAWRRQQQAEEEVGRRMLAGCIPLPYSCCSGGVREPKASALRPGVDVCGMCMDNNASSPAHGAAHAAHAAQLVMALLLLLLLLLLLACWAQCIMCARARCHQLELRELVTCPFCTALVHDFVLA